MYISLSSTLVLLYTFFAVLFVFFSDFLHALSFSCMPVKKSTMDKKTARKKSIKRPPKIRNSMWISCALDSNVLLRVYMMAYIFEFYTDNEKTPIVCRNCEPLIVHMSSLVAHFFSVVALQGTLHRQIKLHTQFYRSKMQFFAMHFT